MRTNHKHDRPHQQQVPLLMVPTTDNSTDRRCLYDVTRKSLCEFQLKIPYNIRCGGCSHGWLILVEESFEVTLFNPFSGKAIHLPPLKRLVFEKRYRDEFNEMSALPHLQMVEYEKRMREECDEEEIEYEPNLDEIELEGHNQEEEEEEEGEGEIEQVEGDADFKAERLHQSDYSIVRGVLSSDPDVNMNDYVLMVIYGSQERLAFIKSGDKHWTYIDKNVCGFFKSTYSKCMVFPDRGLWHWKDIICSNGLFYVLDHLGVLLSCDVSSNLKLKRFTELDTDTLHRNASHKTYLVESPEGDLLRVIKIGDDEDDSMTTIGFMIYKLVDSLENPKWSRVRSLGDVSLFLGDNHSTSVRASDFTGCQPNSIFFCDDYFEYYYLRGGPTDIGVCDLHDGTIRRHYSLHSSQKLMPPPLWILPKFVCNHISS